MCDKRKGKVTESASWIQTNHGYHEKCMGHASFSGISDCKRTTR